MITLDDMPTGYKDLCLEILKNGEEVSPRGQLTKELRGVTIKFLDPTRTMPVGINRGLNVAIGAMEALQLIGGFTDPPMMKRIGQNFSNFMRAGSFDGAYGPRVRTQLPMVVERLKRDKDTRQAVLNIWDPLHDMFEERSRDYPCTIFLQFLIRNDKLECHGHMRSNDVWWGLSYDAFQFSQLQCTIANYLQMPAGPYYHHAVSLHMYERDFAKVDDLLYAPTEDLQVKGIGRGHQDVDYPEFRDVMELAETLTQGIPPKSLTVSEQWYDNVLWEYKQEVAK